MTKIFLKPNSPDYAEPGAPPKTRTCDMPGCRENADHRAPKDRSLNHYYHFCLDHVREYNKAWNFFEGMSTHEVEDHILKSFYGDRPTWTYGVNGDAYETLYERAWKTYSFKEEAPPRQKRAHEQTSPHYAATPEHEALAIMGLQTPVTLDEIKTRYKSLAKKHHPDLNPGDESAQELLKQINMAYTILKLAYEKYEKLPDRV